MFVKETLARICLFKVNSGNTKTMCKICSKFTIKTLERQSGIFIVDFEQISSHSSGVSIVDFEQLNATWDAC